MIYRGENATGQHLFGNGSAVVTDLCLTLEEAVRRFGARISAPELGIKYSGSYQCGKEEAERGLKYKTEWPIGSAARLEYGFGYLAVLLATAQRPAEAAPDLAPPPPVAVLQAEPVPPPAKRRGRPRKRA